jgi:3-hydroxyacyl-CoA dehydrogenase
MPIGEIRSAAVIGAGTMGSGIAMCCANAGIDVAIVDAAPEALERARTTIESTYQSQVSKGRLSREEADGRLARISRTQNYDDLAAADVAIEAVFEDLAIKRDVFATLGAALRPDALLATNTSTLDVDAIARSAPHPERAIGMHFFSPAHVMKLLEIVRGADSTPETIEATVALGKRLGKIPVVVGNCDGFVGNRMLLGYKREAEFLVLAGAPPARVDSVLEAFGFAMGPFAVSDLAGVDVGWRSKQERIKRGAAPPFALTNLSDELVAAGRYGQKTAAGYYRYQPGDRARYHDEAVDAIVEKERARLAIAARDVADEEIVERCVYALVIEGARILEEGMAGSAADIDTIWINGYGFPKARGGPMRYAQDAGIARVLATVRGFAAEDPACWRISTRLERAAAAGNWTD